MHWMEKLERKYGRFAVKRLIIYILGAYAVGYMLQFMETMNPKYDLYHMLIMDPEMIILHGQVWRLFTWIITPPQQASIFLIFMFIMYYWIGSTLEDIWGAFRYNVFIFSSLFLMTVTPVLIYLITFIASGFQGGVSLSASTYYLNLVSFLAFATIFPDQIVYFMFFIPIKMKWLAIVDAVFLAITAGRLLFVGFLAAGGSPIISTYDDPKVIMVESFSGVIMILASVLSFLVYFFATRNYKKMSPKEKRRQQNFRDAVNRGKAQSKGAGARNTTKKNTQKMRQQTAQNTKNAWSTVGGSNAKGSRHYCAVCGRTELTNPELQFRFCSKCKGNLEYCNDHLFTHAHRQI